MKTRPICLAAILTIALFSACTKKEEKKKQAPQAVTVTKAIKKDVALYSEFVGQVFGLKDIPIRARVEGFLLSINFKEGFAVKKDQLLYTIDAQSYNADVATQEGLLAETKTRLIQARNDLARIKPLAKVNAVSKSDLDAAIADKNAADAAVSAATASLELSKIQLSYCNVFSPMDGIIGKTKARVGEFVGKDPNPVILNTVSRVDTIRVQFSVTESDYLYIMRRANKTKQKRASERKGTIELILSDGSLHDHFGVLDFIDREVNATTGSIMIQASFPNPDRLVRPGQFAKIRGKVETVKGAILVPQKAVSELQGVHILTVLTAGNIIKKRTVKTGSKLGDYWIIEEGIEEGDQVVYEGIQKVRNNMVVNPELKQFVSQTNVLDNK
jgi:membrane fusion protein (multidrug efflux system)